MNLIQLLHTYVLICPEKNLITLSWIQIIHFMSSSCIIQTWYKSRKQEKITEFRLFVKFILSDSHSVILGVPMRKLKGGDRFTNESKGGKVKL